MDFMMQSHRSSVLRSCFVVGLMLLLTSPTSSEYELPTQKANPPLMDPIPTLPVVTHRAYMDITIDDDPKGRIVFGLFGDVAPKAVENFVALCRCNAHRKSQMAPGKDLCYRQSKFHRIIPNFMIQAGDYTHGDGRGGESIFPEGAFEDESYQVKHNRKYMLCMANDNTSYDRRHRNKTGRSNRSQFFINTVKTQWLQGTNEIFGMVLEGLDVVKAIESKGTRGGTPIAEVVIVDSGEMETVPEDATPRLVSAALDA